MDGKLADYISNLYQINIEANVHIWVMCTVWPLAHVLKSTKLVSGVLGFWGFGVLIKGDEFCSDEGLRM